MVSTLVQLRPLTPATIHGKAYSDDFHMIVYVLEVATNGVSDVTQQAP